MTTNDIETHGGFQQFTTSKLKPPVEEKAFFVFRKLQKHIKSFEKNKGF